MIKSKTPVANHKEQQKVIFFKLLFLKANNKKGAKKK